MKCPFRLRRFAFKHTLNLQIHFLLFVDKTLPFFRIDSRLTSAIIHNTASPQHALPQISPLKLIIGLRQLLITVFDTRRDYIGLLEFS
jgi:hypothetical protein